eukprot:352824-Chlamydomonas_euryale.AAC.9
MGLPWWCCGEWVGSATHTVTDSASLRNSPERACIGPHAHTWALTPGRSHLGALCGVLAGTSLEDDVARLQARRVSDIELAALGFRIEKKRILRDCLAALGGGGGGGGGAKPAESAGVMPAVTVGKQAGGF